MNATQIFVASEENVKFEVSGVSTVQPAADPITSSQANQQPQQQQQQQQQQQKPCKCTVISIYEKDSSVVFIKAQPRRWPDRKDVIRGPIADLAPVKFAFLQNV